MTLPCNPFAQGLIVVAIAHPGGWKHNSFPQLIKDCQEVQHKHPAPASLGDALVDPEVCLQVLFEGGHAGPAAGSSLEAAVTCQPLAV